MKPRIIWLDDEIKARSFVGTVVKFKRFFDIIECQTIDEFKTLAANNTWDAAIFDVINKDGDPSDIIDALLHYVREDALYFVFSGQDSITKEDNYIKNLIAKRRRSYSPKNIYVKNEDDELLIKDILAAVESKEDWEVENKYEKVLSIAKDYCKEDGSYKYLFEILLALHGVKTIDYKLYYNRLRIILEWVFRRANKLGLLHDKCIDEKNKINLTDSCLFLSGRPANHSGVQCRLAHFPILISKNVWLLLEITGGASHTTEVDVEKNINLTSYWNEINTPYLLYSLTFILCDVLLWAAQYFEEHQDVGYNKSLWLDLSPEGRVIEDLINNYKDFVGIVERDEKNNYHIKDCLLPYKGHPEIGSKIKLTSVIVNTNKLTSKWYPVFAQTYE